MLGFFSCFDRIRPAVIQHFGTADKPIDRPIGGAKKSKKRKITKKKKKSKKRKTKRRYKTGKRN